MTHRNERFPMNTRWILVSCTCLLLTHALHAENWPQWRGPRGTGISRERSVPLVWSEDRGLAWKCPLPAWGDSSPIVWDRSIFLTSQTEDGQLLLLNIGVQSGNVLWTQQVGQATVPRGTPERGHQIFHQLQNMATPTPVTNGEVVVVHFGNGDLAAYDFNGGQLWKRNLQQDYGEYTIWWGHANSPVIFQDLVISVCMQDSLADLQDESAPSYVVAHEVTTGRVRWFTPRLTSASAEECDAYTTPLLAEVAGQPRLIVMGGNQLDTYDPRTGKQVWCLKDLVGGRTVTNPTVDEGMIFATRGKRGDLFAVALQQHPGELERRSVLWSDSQGTPDSCSPVSHQLRLFTISDDGIARCFDNPSGKLRWKKRLAGDYKASPVYAQGRVLFLNTEGLCTIVSGASRFDKLVENQLRDHTIASPAISNGHIFIRGRQYLYCIGDGF